MKYVEDHAALPDRGHVFRADGSKVKFLSVTLWGYEKQFFYRLAEDDERKTFFLDGLQWCHEWFEQLPVMRWAEVIYPAA